MKFSIIIPLYNKAPYVKKALESVFAQTYTDFELIVVDDGSTDDSARIAEEYIREVKGYSLEVKGEESSKANTNAYNLSPINYKLNAYNLSPINYKLNAYNLSPITYKLSVRLITQSNAGVSAARNSGVALSHGNYIAFLDADDWWEPTYLEKMAQLIADYPDAGLYASNYTYYKPGKIHIAVNNLETGYINYPKAYYESNAMPIWTGATMIPRNVFEEMGGFPFGIKLGEDFLLWSKIALQYKVAFLNEALAWYNNDVPATLRATRNLHAPEHHMLFRMEEIIGDRLEVIGNEDSGADTFTSTPYTLHHTPTNDDWRRLIDMLRLLGLHSYWLSDEYHELAQKEIDKVDMSQQYDFLVKLYRTPRWQQKCKQRILQMASGPIALLKRLKQGKKTTHTNIVITNKEYRKSMGLPD